LDARGYPQFEDLMFCRGELFFVTFDALYLDGKDVRNRPLIERKARLQAVLPVRRGGRATALPQPCGTLRRRKTR
jgi:ATP-dependent DNA ligase